MVIPQVIMFSDFFPNEDLNVLNELKKYKRETLLKLVSILGLNFGNACFPEMQYFSQTNNYSRFVKNQFEDYKRKTGCSSAYYCTYKTSLELLRYIFSIDYNDFNDTIALPDAEFTLLKILLKINEELFPDIKDAKGDSAKTLYFMYYAMNDMVNVDIQHLYFAQLLYDKMLFHYLTYDQEANSLMYSKFLKKYGVSNWKQYASVIEVINLVAFKHGIDKEKGLVPFKKELFHKDIQRLIDDNVLEELCLWIEDYIPYDSVDKNDRNNNVDYRVLRSKPFIKGKDGYFYLYNYQLLLEQLYNSIVFTLKEMWDDNIGSFFQYFNKHFVEEFLFQRVMLDIVEKTSVVNAYYPRKEYILTNEKPFEEDDAPDFYCREREKLLLFECKSIMINGSYKEKDSVFPLINELKHKLYDDKKSSSVMVKQLAKHILNIEKETVDWDKRIPQKKYYYPIFVVSDMKLVQPGLMSIVNEWFYEEMNKKGLQKVSYRPIVVVSIDILYLYSRLFCKQGIGYYINHFLKKVHAQFLDGKWCFDIDADFNLFMKSYGLMKHRYLLQYAREILRQ